MIFEKIIEGRRRALVARPKAKQKKSKLSKNTRNQAKSLETNKNQAKDPRNSPSSSRKPLHFLPRKWGVSCFFVVVGGGDVCGGDELFAEDGP